jgi:hypothetical protein
MVYVLALLVWGEGLGAVGNSAGTLHTVKTDKDRDNIGPTIHRRKVGTGVSVDMETIARRNAGDVLTM